MLGIVLGFSGRIGRLRYFLLSSFLAFAAAALIFAILFATASRGASLGLDSDAKGRAELICLIVVLPLFLWFSFALQAKRIRDIGWSPLLVIPAWLAAQVLDAAIARANLLPATAVHAHNGTAFGLTVNLAMGGVLLFWPGCEPDTWVPPPRRFDPPRAPSPEPRTAPIPTRSDPAAPIAFGRRGRA